MSKLFCLVENGIVIDGPAALPKNTREASNLRHEPKIAETFGWFPCIITYPEIGKNQKRGNKVDVITDNSVEITWEVIDLTNSEIDSRRERRILGIKAEARRRIINKSPEWKRINMITRAIELDSIDYEDQTTDEKSELYTIRKAWRWIKTIRTISDVLEADPPVDYKDDKYWT